MAQKSEAHDALRSLLPEARLIRERDAAALSYKYRAELFGSWSDRAESLLRSRYWSPELPDFTQEYAPEKTFDGLWVEAKAKSPVKAYHPETNAKLRMNKKDATFLHITAVAGLQHARMQLGVVAEYINANKKLRQTEYVAGVTYSELGRLAVALGFQEMRILRLSKNYELCLQASHMAFCAINGKEAEFRPSTVFLPTEQFIETFRPVDTSSLLLSAAEEM